jgi:hypothetical protein
MSKGGLILAFAGGLLVATPEAPAAAILVGAPTTTYNTIWDTQGNVPPSGPISEFADQFSLSQSKYVSAITALIDGLSTSPSTFQLDLSRHLGSAPLYSATFSSPTSTMTFTLPVAARLAAGTYHLQLVATGYVGWWSSDGTFVTTAGTVADGMWENYAGDGWTFLTPSFDNSQPGVFKVLGRRKGAVPEASTDFALSSAVPEPSTWATIMLGFAGLGLAGYGRFGRAR